jgi:diadenylate cyclase
VQESEKSRSQSLFHLELVSLLDHIAVLLRPLSLPVVESLLGLAIEIAQEGREGRRIGTIFMVGDPDLVLRHSRPLILDPLAGHSAAARRVADPNLRGTIKELAQLDGAFVISESGVFLAACRYLDAKAAEVTLPLGLGARHMAAGAMSKISSSVGIVVSETATVRIFRRGRLIAQISCAPKPRLEEFLTPDIEAADEPFGT